MNIYKDEGERLADWASFYTIKFFMDVPPKNGQSSVMQELLAAHFVNQTYFVAMLKVLEKSGIKREDVQQAFAEEAAKLCQKLERANPGFRDTGGHGIRKVDSEAAERTMAAWR